jgi:RHS repeat-associated protein
LTPEALCDYDAAGNRTTFTEDGVSSTATPNAFNQLTEIAAANQTMLFKGTVSKPSTITLNGATVTMNGLNWEASAAVVSGANSLSLQATELNPPPGSNPHVTTRHINFTLDGQFGHSIGYDDNGSMTNNGLGQTYQWDAENRLITITYANNTSTHFTYDGLSRWDSILEKDAGGTVTSEKHFIWDGFSLAEERDPNNNVSKRFFGQGEQRADLNLYYTRDHLGSIREMVDSNGVVQARYDYAPWGERTKLVGDLDCDFGFTGHYQHAPSGLTVAPFRFYSAELGRWLSRDPLGEAGGLNLYQYAANNPGRWTDPLGLTIVVQPADRSNYRIARRYLEQDPTMRKIFAQLDRSPRN